MDFMSAYLSTTAATFAELNLNPKLLEALSREGYTGADADPGAGDPAIC